MVMLMAPLGNPLMVELRGLVGVDVPGCVTSSSTALRVANGSSVIWRSVSVLVISADSACTIGVPPVTVTVSVACPTSNLVSTTCEAPEAN